MKQLGYALLIVLFTLFVCGCNDKKPKQLRVEKTTVDKDLLRIYDKDIRQYFIDFDEVGLDGVCAMGVKKQVKYTDIAVELIYEALRREGFTSVSNEDARKAILKYYNIDISKSNKFLVKRLYLLSQLVYLYQEQRYKHLIYLVYLQLYYAKSIIC